MVEYSQEEKDLFCNYDKDEYEKILNDKSCNCFNCINYKTGHCILIEIAVTAMYVCPHFKSRKGEKNGNI